jgi:hypothetical protein
MQPHRISKSVLADALLFLSRYAERLQLPSHFPRPSLEVGKSAFRAILYPP